VEVAKQQALINAMKCLENDALDTLSNALVLGTEGLLVAAWAPDGH
jgi:hypothetical protein